MKSRQNKVLGKFFSAFVSENVSECQCQKIMNEIKRHNLAAGESKQSQIRVVSSTTRRAAITKEEKV